MSTSTSVKTTKLNSRTKAGEHWFCRWWEQGSECDPAVAIMQPVTSTEDVCPRPTHTQLLLDTEPCFSQKRGQQDPPCSHWKCSQWPGSSTGMGWVTLLLFWSFQSIFDLFEKPAPGWQALPGLSVSMAGLDHRATTLPTLPAQRCRQWWELSYWQTTLLALMWDVFPLIRTCPALHNPVAQIKGYSCDCQAFQKT